MKVSISDKIVHEFRKKYLERDLEWYNGGDIERKLSELFACKPSTVSRTLRDLTENNNGQWLEKEERKCLYSNKRTVWYRYIPSKYDRINKYGINR